MITIYFLIVGFSAGWLCAAMWHKHMQSSFWGVVAVLAGCAVWPISLVGLLALAFMSKAPKL